MPQLLLSQRLQSLSVGNHMTDRIWTHPQTGRISFDLPRASEQGWVEWAPVCAQHQHSNKRSVNTLCNAQGSSMQASKLRN